jgi:hypothetical protein
MIIIYFIFDFILMNMLPISTYFFVIDIDRSSKWSVLIVGILLDFIYGMLFVNTILLFCLYLLMRSIKVGGRYRVVKNLIIYLLFMVVGIYL